MPEDKNAQQEQPAAQTATTPEKTGSDATSNNNAEPSWLPDRLKRAEEAAVNKLLSALGVKTTDELKSVIKTAADAKAAQQSDLEKAASRAETAEKERDEAKAKIAEFEAKQRAAQVDEAIKKIADAEKAEHSGDVVMHLRVNSAALVKAWDEKGEIDEKEAKKLVEALKTERPTWFPAKTPGSPSNKGGKNPEPEEKLKQEAALEQFSIMRRSF